MKIFKKKVIVTESNLDDVLNETFSELRLDMPSEIYSSVRLACLSFLACPQGNDLTPDIVANVAMQTFNNRFYHLFPQFVQKDKR